MEEKHIDRAWTIGGTGVTVFFALLPFEVKDMAPWIVRSGLAVGILLIGYGLWPLLGRLRLGGASAMPSVLMGAQSDEAKVTNDEIPLSEAARMALEAIDGSVFSGAARRPFNAPKGALCFLAERLYADGVPIYGKQVPSSKSMAVPDTALFGAAFAQDATVIEDDSSHRVTYSDLMVRRSDLDAAIISLKERHPPSPS